MAYKPFIMNILGLTGSAESGGYIDSYVKGISTPLTLYADDVGTPAGTSVTADALGQITFYFKDDLEYSWKAYTADGSVNLWAANVVGGALTLTYINPAYAVFPLIEASWALPLATPLHSTWPDLFRDGPAALPDIINTTTIVTDIAALRLLSGDEATDGVRVATGRAAGFWRWGNGDQSATVVAATKTVGSVDAGADTLTITSHYLLPGDGVLASAASAGLSLSTLYYVSKVDADTIKLHTSVAAAIDGTSVVDLSALVGSLSLRLLRDPGEVHTVIPTGLALDGSEGCWIKSTDRVFVHTWEAGAVVDGVTNDAGAVMACEALARQSGMTVRFQHGDYYLSSEVAKANRTSWEGVGGSRSARGVGTNIVTAGNLDFIQVWGEGINRHAGISKMRMVNSDRATYTTARAIVNVGDVRDHYMRSMIVGNYYDNYVSEDGSGLHCRDCNFFGAIRHSVFFTNVTDAVFTETQFAGDVYGAYFYDCYAIQVNVGRPQVSDTANIRFELGAHNSCTAGFNDSAVNGAGTGGLGLELIDQIYFTGVATKAYSNGDGQPHVFIDAPTRIATDITLIGFQCIKGTSGGTVAAVEFGECVAGAKRVTFSSMNLANCDVGVDFSAITGTVEDVTIDGTCVLPTTNGIVGADTVTSGLKVYDTVQAAAMMQYFNHAADVVLDGASHFTQRFTGSITTGFNVDLPTTGNFEGKAFRLVRSATGTGVITVRHSGGTVVGYLRAAGESMLVATTSTGSGYAIMDASISEWRRSIIEGPATGTTTLTCGAMYSGYTTTADIAPTDIVVSATADPYAPIFIRNGTAANTVTLTHNTSKIRCPDATNFALGPYEMLQGRFVNSTNTILQIQGPAV